MPNPAPGFAKKPDHRVEIDPVPQPLELRHRGDLAARSDRARVLREDGYPDRRYFPREDAAPGVLAPSDRETYCPFKGAARYWHLQAGGETLENAVWAYDAPYDEFPELAGLICVDEDRLAP
jgi:uncharacterized protein (DUF427 family)